VQEQEFCGPHAVSRRELLGRGLTRFQLTAAVASGELVRVRRGVYAAAPLTPRGRHLLSGGRADPAYVEQVRAVLLSLGSTAAASGRTAAVLWGFDLAVEPRDVEVHVAAGRTHVRLDGVVVHARDLRACEVRVVPGHGAIRLTSAAATVVECALTRPLAEGVAVADSALRSGLMSVEELVRAVDAHAGRPGARRLRHVLSLVDPGCESVLESLVRVLLVTHGMLPLSQHLLLTRAGAAVARADFAWPDARLLLECDGRRWHDPADARDRDRRRDNEVVRLGWRVLRVSWDEVVRHPVFVVELIRDALLAGIAA